MFRPKGGIAPCPPKYATGNRSYYAAVSSVENVSWPKIAIFRQILKEEIVCSILILFLIYSKIGIFNPNFAF